MLKNTYFKTMTNKLTKQASTEINWWWSERDVDTEDTAVVGFFNLKVYVNKYSSGNLMGE